MGQTWRAYAAFGAALLMGACSNAASPPAAPTGTPRVAATAASTPASVTWDGQGAPTSESPFIDLFGPPGVTTTSGSAAIASAAPTKDSLSAWVAAGIATNYQAHSDTCPPKPDSVQAVTIGGQPG